MKSRKCWNIMLLKTNLFWKIGLYNFYASKEYKLYNIIKVLLFLLETLYLFNRTGILIIGTKKNVYDIVKLYSIRTRCHYVNKKWKRGTLTNISTVEIRLKKFIKSNIKKKECTYIDGIKYMMGLPNVVIVIDKNDKEKYAAQRECIILGIPTICISYNLWTDISIPIDDYTIQLIIRGFISVSF
uniref:Small ribosomal subunit protein uS2c n=1 Tax=Sciaphila thaidanica TaxID=2161793 RepID=A0A2R4PAK6_9LILI|nr:ribosomal protein S2 [Sciaphila thaidanica]